MTQGGTELYCQECKAYTKQKSLGWTDQSQYSSIGIDFPGKYSYPVGDQILEVFQRVRQCLECLQYFATFELNEEDFFFLLNRSKKLFNIDFAIHDTLWNYQNTDNLDERSKSEEAN